MGEFIFNLLMNVLEGLSYAGGWRSTPPPSPMQPTMLETLGMVFGVFFVFLGLMELGVFVHQSTSERLVLREAAVQAAIVSIERPRSGSDHYADVRVDYQRQGPSGPVACRRVLVRLGYGSQDLEVGQTVQLHPQPGGCSQPIYAPDIGNPQKTLWGSLIAFPVGIAMACGCYSSMRRRQRRLAKIASVARPTPAIS